MELRQLRYFLKAKELLNFTEAAHSLHISQSTLSQQIKQLEAELGIPLFDRIGKRIVLTEAGRMFADYAIQSVYKADSGFQVLQDLNNLGTGEVRIGVTHGLRHVLTNALLRFSKAYPSINLQVVFGTTEELTERLTNFELDFVMSFQEAQKVDRFNYQLLFHAPMTLVASKKSAEALRTEITMEEISQLPLALPAKGYSTRRFITEVLLKSGLTPTITFDINDIPTLIDLVKTGNWYTILAKTTVSEKDDVVTIPIKGKDMMRKAMILSLKETYEKKAVKAFYQIIQETTKDLI